MKIAKTSLDGLYIIELEKFPDNRGYYLPLYNEMDYAEAITEAIGQPIGYMKQASPINFVEHCLSYSKEGVLRGLHYDPARWKLCQCLSGRIFYVAVDPVSRQSHWMVLSAESPRQVLKSPRLAHGFQCMSRDALFYYMMSEYYDPGREVVYKWNEFDIPWPVLPPILSEKDSN